MGKQIDFTNWGGDGKRTTLYVHEYVIHRLSVPSADGWVEGIESRVDQLTRSFGRLIETLAEKDLLDDHEIMRIVGWSDDSLPPNRR